MIIGSCKKQADYSGGGNGVYYTCPMHPSVVSHSPGVCPVCNMSLIKVEKNANDHSGHKGNRITLDIRQQKLAGIQTDTVELNQVHPRSSILGKVTLDETQITTVSSRVSGRIDKLHIRASGEFIHKGSPLYEIYSEELLAIEKEFLLLIEKNQMKSGDNPLFEGLLASVRNKLLLWGLTPAQLTELINNKSASPLITFFSPEPGYVTDVLINEGMYVTEGSPIVKIARLNQVWVEAQVYSNEDIKRSLFKVMTSPASDVTYDGRLVYNNPVLEADRKIQLLRIKVENAEGNLIPGMMVYVSSNEKNNSVLSIPESAVLLEKMKTVWVKVNETTFEQRMVETGKSNGNLIEVLSGVKENEIVVSSGAYLINSEFILKTGSSERHNH